MFSVEGCFCRCSWISTFGCALKEVFSECPSPPQTAGSYQENSPDKRGRKKW